jgi:uncharacterized membrane protein
MAVSFNTNLKQVASKYLALLGMAGIERSFIEKLTAHPQYPSLLSLSHAFDYFKINNKGFNAQQQELETIPTPFIAYLSNKAAGKDFAVVQKAEHGKVVYYADKLVHSTTADFLKRWLLIGFIVNEEDIAQTKQHYKDAYSSHRTAAIQSAVAGFMLCLVFLVPFGYFIAASGSWPMATAMAFFKTAGCLISMALLYYETGKSNSFIKNICTAGQKTNCDAVLSSKAASIGGISWSQAGFYYFGTGLLLLMLPHTLIDFNTKTTLLTIAATAAAAYIPFSIYYQYKIVKSWCPLCLATQVVLFGELLLYALFTGTFSIANISTAALLPVAFCMVVPILIWYYAKPLLLQAKDAVDYKAAYKRVMYNPEIFNSMLAREPAAPPVPQGMGIVMGNPAAPNTLLKVCNPYCRPCSQSHKDIEQLLQATNTINVKIIYRVPDVAQDKSGPVVKHFLALHKKHNATALEKILMEWYKADNKDFDAFAKKHAVEMGENEFDTEIADMLQWCEEANVSHTPFLFFNGRQLPEFYTVEDLQQLLT